MTPEQEAQRDQWLLQIKEQVTLQALEMKLIDCEFVEEGADRKFFIYYTSHKRVDFRQLCRDLYQVFKCRIEMRRLTDRQVAQRLGGINTCKHSRIPCFIPWCHTSRWGGCFYDKEEEATTRYQVPEDDE